MRHPLVFASVLLLLVASCGPRQQAADHVGESMFISEAHQAFFDHLSGLCGQVFAGEQIYRSHHASGWADQELIMHVRDCGPGHIHIPFRIGEDRSRTWMFLAEDGRLRFRHDHRYPDGTPEEESLYGGYADDTGNALVQHFPADEYTGMLIEGGAGNIWTVGLSEDLSTFTYRLERDGEKRLRVDFDLSRPLSPAQDMPSSDE